MRDKRIGVEDGFKSLMSVFGVVSGFNELRKMMFDLAFVPGAEDGFHIWEVLVERRTSNASLFGDLGHGH